MLPSGEQGQVLERLQLRRAALLGLDPGGPLLRCQQRTEDESGRPIELCEMVYRGDRYRFRATLVRGA